jgi:hypothetical protein
VEDLRTADGKRPDPKRAIALLESWLEGDEEDLKEQQETMALLRKALNEGRRPGYELFP